MMASGATSLGTPGRQQAAADAGATCRVLARGTVAMAQMGTQVAQLLAEFAAAEMEGDADQINLARARLWRLGDRD